MNLSSELHSNGSIGVLSNPQVNKVEWKDIEAYINLLSRPKHYDKTRWIKRDDRVKLPLLLSNEGLARSYLKKIQKSETHWITLDNLHRLIIHLLAKLLHLHSQTIKRDHRLFWSSPFFTDFDSSYFVRDICMGEAYLFHVPHTFKLGVALVSSSDGTIGKESVYLPRDVQMSYFEEVCKTIKDRDRKRCYGLTA